MASNNQEQWFRQKRFASLRQKQMFDLTLSVPAFPVVRQAGGRGRGSEAQMPKIKVNINRLKWNFAWVIIPIKAFLLQNLSLVARLVLEI